MRISLPLGTHTLVRLIALILLSTACSKGQVLIDDLVFGPQATLGASNAESSDEFGYSVAISGDYAVVGAPNESSRASGVNGDGSDNSLDCAGAAYVFCRTKRGWVEEAYLKPPVPEEDGEFGKSVAISGSTIAISYGEDHENSVIIYERDASGWHYRTSLIPTHESGFPPRGGSRVAISGDTVIQAFFPWADVEDGAVFVFGRTESGWEQQASLEASDPERWHGFGGGLDLQEDTIVISSKRDSTGAAYAKNDQEWRLQAHLGDSPVGGYFGGNVSVSKDGAVIGSPDENERRGAIYVYSRSGVEWNFDSRIEDETDGARRFGKSVVISDKQIAIRTAAGAQVFRNNGTSWVLESALQVPDPDEDDDSTGSILARSGNTIILGAGEAGSNFTGLAYILDLYPSFAIQSITRTAEGIRISLPNVSNHEIGLAYSTDFSDGSWIELGDFFSERGEMLFLDVDQVRLRRDSGYYRAFARPQ